MVRVAAARELFPRIQGKELVEQIQPMYPFRVNAPLQWPEPDHRASGGIMTRTNPSAGRSDPRAPTTLRLRLRARPRCRAHDVEGVVGRQGRKSRRDDVRARTARAARFHHRDDGLSGLLATRLAACPSTMRSTTPSRVSRRKMQRQFGDHVDPLLVSVRSGAQFSMPGMMDTVLNLGLNDASVAALVARTGDAAIRLRLLRPFHRYVRTHRSRHRRRALR